MIDHILSNEKYVGDVLMQKSFTEHFLTGKRKKNEEKFRTLETALNKCKVYGHRLFSREDNK